MKLLTEFMLICKIRAKSKVVEVKLFISNFHYAESDSF